MKDISYLSGHDVREPVGEGRKIITHCCNSIGKMGSGVAKALLDKWPQVRSEYVQWYKTNKHNDLDLPFALGRVQFVYCEEDIVVANVIGQHDIKPLNGVPPVRYDALREGFNHIAKVAKHFDATVHVPYLMGCDLAGGDWDIVVEILREEVIAQGINLTAYDLFNKRKFIK